MAAILLSINILYCDPYMYSLTGKKILITGVCGTVGSAIARELLDSGKYSDLFVRGVDIQESAVFNLSAEYSKRHGAQFMLGDIRSVSDMMAAMLGVDIVLHTAALKHVSICERQPFDAVRTNLIGVQNIIRAAAASGVQRVILTSSDKAVNPSSNMGASKLLGEGLFTAANRGNSDEIFSNENLPIFAATRFGNVLGSNGSVLPIFAKQISTGQDVTLTHSEMSRFVMGIRDAVGLVLKSVSMARGGEIFVTKMPILRVDALARVMIDMIGPRYGRNRNSIFIREIGAKPGEKLYEELMTANESQRAIELSDYHVILPHGDNLDDRGVALYPGYIGNSNPGSYSSADGPFMSDDEIRAFLLGHRLLDMNN